MHTPTNSVLARNIVKVALVATLALVAIEFVAGVLAHSLALLSDGWHNLTDVPTLLFAWLALDWERKPPDQQRTFGYQRAGVIAAFVNALLLIAVALYICYEGYKRVVQPQPVASGMMLAVGIVAMVINGGISLALLPKRGDLNLRAVFVHNLGDALSNVGIIVGALLIRQTGRDFIDPLLAFLIAGMILWTAVGILSESGNILLEGLPRGMDLEQVAKAMLAVPGVREVHDIHIWNLDARSPVLACHVQVIDMPTSESEKIGIRLREMLARQFGITHITLQFEHTHEPGDFHKYMPELPPSHEATDR